MAVAVSRLRQASPTTRAAGLKTLAARSARLAALAAVLASVGLLAASAGAQDAPPNDYGPLPTLGGVVGVSRIEPRFTSIAVTLSKPGVQVRCWAPVDWRRLTEEMLAYTNGRTDLSSGGGYTSPDDLRVNLTTNACSRLAALTYRKLWPATLDARYPLATAVAILAHEVQHLRGVNAEAEAECFGQQSVRRIGRMLGVRADRANLLAAISWRYSYPRLPESYKSPECRNGGRLDMRPVDSRWP